MCCEVPLWLSSLTQLADKSPTHLSTELLQVDGAFNVTPASSETNVSALLRSYNKMFIPRDGHAVVCVNLSYFLMELFCYTTGFPYLRATYHHNITK